MLEYKTGSDIGGFGRLAQAELTKRREERLDKQAGERSKLMDVQLKQAQSNLQEINRKKKLRDDLGLLSQNIPEGENRFTAQYKYLMENGASDIAHEAMKRQSNLIETVRKTGDYEKADKLFNETIGRVSGGLEIKSVPGKDDIVEAIKDGQKVYLKRTNKGFVPYEMPEDYQIPTKKDKGVALKDKNLQVIESLYQKVTDGTATPAEQKTYQLAEHDYTREKRFTDPVTGNVYTESPTLPAGFPTLKKKKVVDVPGIDKKEDLSPQEVEKSLGEIKFKEILDPARLNKTEMTKYRSTVDATKLMLGALREMKQDVIDNGTRTTDVSTISKRQTDYNQILMRYKEILNLGVLNGPDLEIMERILKKPTGAGAIALGADWVTPSYDSVINQLEGQLRSIESKTGGVVKSGLKQDINERAQILQAENPNASTQDIAKKLKAEGYN